MEKRYKLTCGSQVREEDFGLLFYTMEGPRLYFLSSGELLGPSFFYGELTVAQWMQWKGEEHLLEGPMKSLKKALDRLRDKGVIIEC
jgi:putative mycofactocin binding protein MftB